MFTVVGVDCIRVSTIIEETIDFLFISWRGKVAGMHRTTRKAVYFAGEVMFRYHVATFACLPVKLNRVYIISIWTRCGEERFSCIKSILM